MNISKQELCEAISDSYSYADVIRKLNLHDNGQTRKKIINLIDQYNIDFSHRNARKSANIKNTIWIQTKKECPICGSLFKTKIGHPREKKTCSYACSNTFFRTGRNNGKYISSKKDSLKRYRRLCFEYHKKECIVCGESKIVAVHHVDENHENNSPENLVPLCPTHHQYVHSRYRDEVEPIINQYLDNFKKLIILNE